MLVVAIFGSSGQHKQRLYTLCGKSKGNYVYTLLAKNSIHISFGVMFVVTLSIPILASLLPHGSPMSLGFFPRQKHIGVLISIGI
jgi:hypothetical protein